MTTAASTIPRNNWNIHHSDQTHMNSIQTQVTGKGGEFLQQLAKLEHAQVHSNKTQGVKFENNEDPSY
jgi:hypothetical protein